MRGVYCSLSILTCVFPICLLIVEHILKAIDECEGLTALKLSGNSFGVEAMEAIGEVLAQKPLLSKALWSDLFVSRLKTEIPPALVRLYCLQR